jgi:hypothetical protein
MNGTLLYVVRPGDRNEELRYSLRSAAANLPHDRVLVVSPGPPRWLSVDVEVLESPDEGGHKWRNIPAAILAGCRALGSGPALIMNDDFFVLDPVGEVRPWRRGTMVARAARSRSRYDRGFTQTAEWLRAHYPIAGEPWDYEAHAPMPIDVERMAEVLDLAAATFRGDCFQSRSAYGNAVGLEAELREDVKVWGAIAAERPFVSTTDSSFAGPAGRRLRQMFPEPCRYERPGQRRRESGMKQVVGTE